MKPLTGEKNQGNTLDRQSKDPYLSYKGMTLLVSPELRTKIFLSHPLPYWPHTKARNGYGWLDSQKLGPLVLSS